jgi:hypothetical protein
MKTLNILLITVILFSSCKKDNQETLASRQNADSIFQTNERLPENVSVSTRGFLVFSTMQDFFDYTDFVANSTHQEVQEYLDWIDFNSIGETIYVGEYLEQIVDDEEHAADYVLGADGVVQIQGVIMKPTSDSLFLLTVTEENLDDQSYEYLIEGTFDQNTMNKFATNASDTDIFDIISQTPAGYEDTESNEGERKKKFWGWQCVSNQGLYPDGNCIIEACTAVHCIFWICGQEQTHIISINCI